jgi:hypothetical protein
MRTRLGAAVLALTGGLLLVLAGAMAFMADGQEDWHRLAAAGGYGVAIGALVLVGYGMVAGAPVWLRLIVSVGLPLLAVSVWQLVVDAIESGVDGWKGPATARLAAGVLMLLVGVILLVSGREEPAPSSGHRARRH